MSFVQSLDCGFGHCVLALRLLAVGLLASACVDEGESLRRREPAPIVWQFDGAPTHTVVATLWPTNARTPERITQHLLTSAPNEMLLAEVAGADPRMIWEFPEPVLAGSFRVRLYSRQPSELQLFWAGESCRSFHERCSARTNVKVGPEAPMFLLPSEPIREIRLDFTETDGHWFGIERMELLAERQIVETIWESAEPETTVTREADHLSMETDDGDPWIATALPAPLAEDFDTFELFLGAPRGTTPQLFWRGATCEHFEERCSVKFPKTSGAPVQGTWVDIAQHPMWSGRVDGVRLDPGDAPGKYRLHRLSLLLTRR